MNVFKIKIHFYLKNFILFRDALSTVFDLFDLDSNSRLSKKEFSLYMQFTVGEIIEDKEWENVESMLK